MGRWRWLPTLLAVAAIGANVLMLFSDRAPGLLGRVSARIDARVQAGQLGSNIRLPESDFEIHLLMWAVAALLVGLATWSWGSLLVAGLALYLLSGAVEVLQPEVTALRALQRSDLFANVVGVTTGMSAVAVLGLAWQALFRTNDGRE